MGLWIPRFRGNDELRLGIEEWHEIQNFSAAHGVARFGAGVGGTARSERKQKKVFDGYVEAGGNFIDTADSYQFGESEELVGDFIAPDRDYFVLATKYTLRLRVAKVHPERPSTLGMRRLKS